MCTVYTLTVGYMLKISCEGKAKFSSTDPKRIYYLLLIYISAVKVNALITR